MFKEARIKLTLYYLIIIMTISMFFSLIIYSGATSELRRIEKLQMMRRNNSAFLLDPEIIIETKSRISSSLIVLNIAILAISGLSGFFLAGKTLDPIQKNMEEQKDFVSNASHELRTPLTSLKSEIEVSLRDRNLTLGEAKKLLNSNLEDINSMTKLSNYLLKLNKYESSGPVLNKQTFNLAEVVKKITTKEKVKSELSDTYISADLDSVSELALILIDNAKKYSLNKNKVEVVVKNKTLVVRDQGEGIPAIDLPHIFERFYRGDKARNKGGYGLGLSIAKEITDAHNAKIKVESKIGLGTTFKVIFS